jgi:hypothetical protein
VELQRRVVGDDGIGREPTRQEERVDQEVLRTASAGDDRVEALSDVQEVPGAHVVAENRLADCGLARISPTVRGNEVLEPENGVRREVVERLHVGCHSPPKTGGVFPSTEVIWQASVLYQLKRNRGE